jgi:hypothetical protein
LLIFRFIIKIPLLNKESPMSLAIVAASVSFIACHGGPADHFATFTEVLRGQGHTVQVYATGVALQKLKERNVEGVIPFALDDEAKAAEELAQKCAGVTALITDVGHPFDITLQKTLSEKIPQVSRIAYYDNPESYVPGGYSDTALKVMRVAQKALFANANLVDSDEIALPRENRVGLGFFPRDYSQKIAEKRKSEKSAARAHLFKELKIKDRGEKVFVYAGGNNDAYFSKAFPAFLGFLKGASEEMANHIVILQQHPGAKGENQDGKLVEKWNQERGERGPMLAISPLTSDEAQVIADQMIYYQTSMAPQFALAGIPTIQAGHEVYNDLLVKRQLCSVATDVQSFKRAIAASSSGKADSSAVEEGVGIRLDWKERLERVVLNY